MFNIPYEIPIYILKFLNLNFGTIKSGNLNEFTRFLCWLLSNVMGDSLFRRFFSEYNSTQHKAFKVQVRKWIASVK